MEKVLQKDVFFSKTMVSSIMGRLLSEFWRSDKLIEESGLCHPSCTKKVSPEVEERLRWFPHNIRAIMAKIKLPEKPGGMLSCWIQLTRTRRDLSSQADPAKENWTWSCPYFTQKRRFASVNNTATHTLSILTMFDSKFLENGWEFNRGVTHRNELQWVVLDSVPKVTVLWVDF